jgi:benzoylformate decarboxylase
MAEKAALPVVAPSPSRAPFPTRHPLFQGILPAGIGTLAEKSAGHDVIVAFGAAIFAITSRSRGPTFRTVRLCWAVSSDPDGAARAPVGSMIVADPGDAVERAAEAVVATDRVGPHLVARAEAPLEGPPFSAESDHGRDRAGKSDDAVIVLEWTLVDTDGTD